MTRNTELATQINTLAATVAELENEIGDVEAASQSKIGDLREELQTLESTFAADQDYLKEEIPSTFNDLQIILEYVTDKAEDLDNRIANVHQDYYGWRKQLEEERERLQQLKQDVSECGTHTGECKTCNSTIDVAVLVTPYCPHCGATLTGVSTQTSWWVLTEVTITTDGAASQQSGILSPDRSAGENADSSSQNRGQPGASETHNSDSNSRSSPTNSQSPAEEPAPGEAPHYPNASDRSKRSDSEPSFDITLDDRSDESRSTEQAHEEQPFGDLGDHDPDGDAPTDESTGSTDSDDTEFDWNTD